MNYKSILVLLLMISILLSQAISQEIVKKSKFKNGLSEEYFVLKEDKNVKHGEILRSYPFAFGGPRVLEYGEYDHGMKTGIWASFYLTDPDNSLKSLGSYKDDLMDGEWQYYYPGMMNTGNIISYFINGLRTSIKELPRSETRFEVEVDTSGQALQCLGRYREGEKTGTWNYYSRTGFLLHSYDHDSRVFIENNIYRSDKEEPICFLGGSERFKTLFITALSELNRSIAIETTSAVKYEVKSTGEYQYLQSYGDPLFLQYVEKALASFPGEWVVLNPDSKKKMKIEIRKLASVDWNQPNFYFEMEAEE